MPNWKEGDRVKIVTRAVTETDRKTNVYFDHMAGLVGTVQNVYGPTEIAVKVDLDSLSDSGRTAVAGSEPSPSVTEAYLGPRNAASALPNPLPPGVM